MKVNIKKLDGGRIEATIELEPAEIQAAHKTAVEELAKNVKVKGYRAGKAPLYAIERQLDPNALAQRTTDVMIRNTLFQALVDNGITVSSQPEVELVKFVPAETFIYKASADLMPEVKLADYKSLKAKRPKATTVSEKDIDQFIQSMANRNREWKEVKRAAQKGDRVVIDFLGKLKGEPFEGGEGKNFTLELGSDTFIPGFEDQLVGHPAGEEFTVEVVFPKDYHAHLAGQKAQFDIKLHKVEAGQAPETDQELAKSLGFDTPAAFREEIRKNRNQILATEAEDRFLDALVQELVKKSKLMIPQGIIDRLAQELHQQTPGAPEQLLQAQAKTRAEMLAVLNALANQMQVSVSDEELNAQIDNLKVHHKDNPELVERLDNNSLVRDDIRARIRLDKVAAELRRLYAK